MSRAGTLANSVWMQVLLSVQSIHGNSNIDLPAPTAQPDPLGILIRMSTTTSQRIRRVRTRPFQMIQLCPRTVVDQERVWFGENSR